MEQSNCLNCGEAIDPQQKFCRNCGQKTDISRITFRSLFRDFLLVFAHTDKGIFNMAKGLTINPGKTVVEYAAGKRKKYLNPFAFLGLCIGLMLFLNNWLKPYNDLPLADPEVLARIADEKMRQLYLLTIERNVRVQKFVNSNLSLASVIVAPYFAFMLWLFFKRSNRNVAEITVTYVLLTGFANVLSTIIVGPFMSYYRNQHPHDFILYGSILLQTLYFSWALNVFFGYKSIAGYFKVFGALFLIGLIGFVLLLIGFFFYIYRGESFHVLKYL
ncbi:MAG: DUF3667 domain-containing protein [Bacteroidia bacterium]|nr:DUF3667 domain-containing protein [Bacteroidia bacterium]